MVSLKIISYLYVSAVYYGVISELGCKHDEKIDLVKYPAKLGITLELCAGIVDKDLSLKEIAREEVLEECGFNISSERIDEVMTYKYVYDNSKILSDIYPKAG